MHPKRAIPPITPPIMAPTGVGDDDDEASEDADDAAIIVVTTVGITDIEEDELEVVDELDVLMGIGIPVPVSVIVGGRETVAEPRAI
jgi:hypothetical protein